MTSQLTNTELKSLMTILQRTNLSGSEAPAFLALMQKINSLIIASEQPKEGSLDGNPKKEDKVLEKPDASKK